MSLPVTVVVLDLRDIFHFFFENNIDSCDRRVGAMSLSLSSATPGTLLVIMVLSWVGGRNLLNGR